MDGERAGLLYKLSSETYIYISLFFNLYEILRAIKCTRTRTFESAANLIRFCEVAMTIIQYQKIKSLTQFSFNSIFLET